MPQKWHCTGPEKHICSEFDVEFQGHVRWTAQSWWEKNSLAYCMNVGGPQNTCTLQGMTNFGIVDTFKGGSIGVSGTENLLDNDIIDFNFLPLF